MNTSTLKKTLCGIVAVMLIVCALPMALAENIGNELSEARFMAQTNRAWDDIHALEAELDAKGLSDVEVTNAIYEYVSQRSDVASITWEDSKSCLFSFTLKNGCLCVYDYEFNHVESYTPSAEAIEVAERSTTTGQNVLLLGPYYGIDGSFTNQYRDEASDLADFLGGNATVYAGYDCDGNACKTLDENYGVIIFDSHGNQIGQSSYLCLNSSAGISAEDFTSGRAYNAGGWYGVTGTFFAHYNDTLPNSMIWMAICLGMATDTICDPMLADGAGIVMGYTESVTFVYDYQMEETVFDCLTGYYDGEFGDFGVFYTAAEAAEIAKLEHGDPDPYGSNRAALRWKGDGEWVMADMGPVAATDVEIAPDPIVVNEHNFTDVQARTTPRYANNYTLEWSSADTSIATVDADGRVFGVHEGTTEITVVLHDDINGQTYTDTAQVRVADYPSVEEAICADGASGLTFQNDTTYPWTVGVSTTGRTYASSTNIGVPNSTSRIALTLDMQAGETLSYDWSVSSMTNDDFLYFKVNDEIIRSISGTTSWRTIEYTAAVAGTYTFAWEYTKNDTNDGGGDKGMIDNIAFSGAQELCLVSFVDGYTNEVIETREVARGTVITQFPTVGEHEGYIFTGWNYSGAAITSDTMIIATFTQFGDADRNGVINSADALYIVRLAAGVMDADEYDVLVCDYNGNGSINAADALAALRVAMN